MNIPAILEFLYCQLVQTVLILLEPVSMAVDCVLPAFLKGLKGRRPLLWVFLYVLICGTVILYVESFYRDAEVERKPGQFDVCHFQTHLPIGAAEIARIARGEDVTDSRKHVLHFLLDQESGGKREIDGPDENVVEGQ